MLDVHAQVREVEIAAIEPGVAGEPVQDGGALLRRQLVAERQGARVIAGGPRLDLGERGGQVALLELGGQLLVVPGGGGVGRQVERVGQLVAAGEVGGLEVEDRGDQQDAVEGDARALDQIAREPRRARGAVALPHQEQRRGPALVAAQVEPDELAHRLQIALHPPELLAELRLAGAAVARPDRIDEAQVGLVEPGVRVVHQLVGRRGHRAVGAHLDALGAECAQVEPHRGRARAAVEREHHGTRGGARHPIERVGHEEDFGLGLALLVLERQLAGGDRVGERLAGDGDLVVRDHRRLGRVRLGPGRGRRLGGRGGLGGQRRGREREGQEQRERLHAGTPARDGKGRWRREWDSNPRGGISAYTISNRAPSTTRTSLRSERATVPGAAAARQARRAGSESGPAP